MSAQLVVAVMQMTSIDHVDSNVQQMEKLLRQVPRDKAVRLVCFPENCLYMRVNEGEAIQGLEIHDPAFSHLAALAQELGLFIHLGALPLRLEGHLYNSAVLITDQGEIRPTYQKMHLFDIQLDGQKAIRESDVFRHGQKPSVFNVDGWQIGESICYDLRFAELFSLYARQEVDAILIPAAFLVKTGQAHWEVLLRARAIESQAYVLASAQGGTHQGLRGGQRTTYGHSLAVDPWGEVMACVEEVPAMALVTLDRSRIEAVRRQIPMQSHRRIPLGSV